MAGSRAEQKARTRNALINSALRLIGEGTNFAAVSLREVAKTAGVVPTSFYRHFGDMDELGLAVIEKLGADVRRLMIDEVDASHDLDELVTGGVQQYVDYVVRNADLVRFVNQARTGGAPPLRTAIEHDLEFFTTRIAAALRDLEPGLAPAERETAARTIVAVLLESTNDMLSLGRRATTQRQEIVDRVVDQIRLVVRGARRAERRTAAPRSARRSAAPKRARAGGGRS